MFLQSSKRSTIVFSCIVILIVIVGIIYLNYDSTKWIQLLPKTLRTEHTPQTNITSNGTVTKVFTPRDDSNEKALVVDNRPPAAAISDAITSITTSSSAVHSYQTTRLNSPLSSTQAPQTKATHQPSEDLTPTNMTANDTTIAPLTSPSSTTRNHDNQTTTRITLKFPFLERTQPTIHFDFTVAPHNFTRAPEKIIPRFKPPSTTKLTLPPSLPRADSSAGDMRYLVYVCNARGYCGGMGDRQRALVSVYVISRLVNRQFYLIMSTPCNLNNFYVPRTYQWEADTDQLEPPNQNNTITASTNGENGWFTKSLTEGDFNVHYPQKVVYVKTNYDLFVFISRNAFYSKLLEKWNGLGDQRVRFYWAWHELMQPSLRLMTHLEYVLGSKFLGRKGLMSSSQVKASEIKPLFDVGDSKLICAHVRMGQNPSLPMDNPFTAVYLSAIPKLHQFMLSKDTEGDAMFFVATDYINIRIRSRNKFGKRFIDYGGKIFHIDRQRRGNGVCEGFGDAALDQLILSLCDVIVVCRSGYSLRAYFMSNITGPVYIMENDEINLFDGS